MIIASFITSNMQQKKSIKKPFLNGKRLIISQSIALLFLIVAIIETILLVHSLSGRLYLLGTFIPTAIVSILLCIVGFAITQVYCYDRITDKGMVILLCYVLFSLLLVRWLSFLYGLGYA